MSLVSWTEPDMWMEKMKGARWDSLVRDYNKKFKAAVAVIPKKSLSSATKRFRDSYADFQKPYFKGNVEIHPGIADLFSWRLVSGSRGHAAGEAAGIDTLGDIIATTEPISSEQYRLVVRRAGKIVWTSPKTVLDSVEIVGDNIYFIEQGEILLWQNRIMCYSLVKDEALLVYEEKDKTYQLNLIRGQNRCLFMTRSNFINTILYHVVERNIVKLVEGDSFPVGNGPADPCYFAATATGWRPVGEALKRITWPTLTGEIEFVDLAGPKIVLLNHGIRSLYDCFGKTPKLLKKGVFIISDYSHVWMGSRAQYRIIEPGAEPDKRPYASTQYHRTESKDGTAVPYIITSVSARPKGMIVHIYGAYGSTSPISSRRWRPYLEAGWCICVAMIRGGGDHNSAWAEAARSYRRERAIEDAEAVIKAARRVAGLMASQTCIYGRSAGGYVIGALVNRHSAGQLFGAVYAEEAFLDVLRTMSNPALPASLAETNEFGNPERIADFETMLRLSPVQNVPAGGISPDAIFIICRTALGDIEVYAYESMKWITRLGTGLLYIKSGAGHFTETQDAFRDMAEDFCLLQNWLDTEHVS